MTSVAKLAVRDPVPLAVRLMSTGVSSTIGNHLSGNCDLQTHACADDPRSILIFVRDHADEMPDRLCGAGNLRLIGEILEFHDRSSANERLSESDIYRALDSIERFLRTAGITQSDDVAILRRESLRRLHASDKSRRAPHLAVAAAWTATYLILALVANLVAVSYLRPPMSWVIAAVVTIVACRLAYLSASGTQSWTMTPRTCPTCGRQAWAANCRSCSALRPTRRVEPAEFQPAGHR